jgi:hypothetical protein
MDTGKVQVNGFRYYLWEFHCLTIPPKVREKGGVGLTEGGNATAFEESHGTAVSDR